MSDPENEKQIQKRGAKHMRLRYYTSYEEASIVKLWRTHLSQISSYTENLQIFREIASGLHQHRIRLNKQEVRRRICSYRNKYLVEKSRVENNPQYKSPWRLYQLIDNMFNETSSSSATKSEQQLIERIETNIRKELPSLSRFTRHDCRAVKFEQDADSCPFWEGQQSLPPIKLEPLHQPSTTNQLPSIKTEPKDYDEHDGDTTEKRLPLAPANRILEQLLNPCDTGFTQPGGAPRRIRRRSFMPRTGQITLAQVEALRKENDLMAEERDICQRSLDLKERQLEQLEQTFDSWLFNLESIAACLENKGVVTS